MPLAFIHAAADAPRAAAVRSALAGAAAPATRAAAVVLLTRAATGDPSVEAALHRARAARVPIVGLRLDAVRPARRWLRAAGPIRWYDGFDGLTADGLSEVADALRHLEFTESAPGAAGVLLPFAKHRAAQRHAPAAASRTHLPASTTQLTPAGKIRCVTTSPDGGMFVLGWDSGLITCWDAVRGERLLGSHGAPVTALAVDHRNRQLAAATAAGSFALWDLDLGRPVRVIGAGAEPRPLAPFTFAQHSLALFSARGNRLETWNLASLEKPFISELRLFERITRLVVGDRGLSIAVTGTAGRALTENEPKTGIYVPNENRFVDIGVKGVPCSVRDGMRDFKALFDGKLVPNFSFLLRGGDAGFLSLGAALARTVAKTAPGTVPLDFVHWQSSKWLLFSSDPGNGAQRLRVRLVASQQPEQAELLPLPGIPKAVSVAGDRIQVLLNRDGRPAVYCTSVPFTP